MIKFSNPYKAHVEIKNRNKRIKVLKRLKRIGNQIQHKIQKRSGLKVIKGFKE